MNGSGPRQHYTSITNELRSIVSTRHLTARNFKKLRLVPASSKVGLPGPARGPNFRKNPAFLS